MPSAFFSAPLSILIADDESSILVALGGLFRGDGHTIGLAGDGTEALRQFRLQKWDVVVTDRAMPGMDGETLAREIKKLSPHTPIVMVTGLPLATCCSAVDAIVPKPFNYATLADTIIRCLAAVVT